MINFSRNPELSKLKINLEQYSNSKASRGYDNLQHFFQFIRFMDSLRSLVKIKQNEKSS